MLQVQTLLHLGGAERLLPRPAGGLGSAPPAVREDAGQGCQGSACTEEEEWLAHRPRE